MADLVIRDAQRPPLREMALRAFQGLMVEHLCRYAPQHSRGIGPAAVRDVVLRGMERAATYGFTKRGPVRFYLELMMLMGSGFDTDPQLPRTMAGILRSGGVDDQLPRADRLHGELLGHMRAVLGPDNRHARAAVARLRTMSSAGLELSLARLERDVLRVFEQVYPERCALTETSALLALVGSARRLAVANGLDPLRGTALCGVLMFELGHRCFDDPLYPWLSRALMAPGGGDPLARTEHLEAKAQAYLALIGRRLERGTR